jgi:hypothetical protein
MDLATNLAACVLGLELCGDVLMESVYAHRPYPRVHWDAAVDHMHTGDLVTARGSIRHWGDLVALVVRDVSGILYALVAGRDPVPLSAWVRQQVGRGAQCCWRALEIAGRPRESVHGRITGMARAREDPFSTLVRAGVLAVRTTSPDMVNCNTAPGHQYRASISVLPGPELEKI